MLSKWQIRMKQTEQPSTIGHCAGQCSQCFHSDDRKRHWWNVHTGCNRGTLEMKTLWKKQTDAFIVSTSQLCAAPRMVPVISNHANVERMRRNRLWQSDSSPRHTTQVITHCPLYVRMHQTLKVHFRDVVCRLWLQILLLTHNGRPSEQDISASFLCSGETMSIFVFNHWYKWEEDTWNVANSLTGECF